MIRQHIGAVGVILSLTVGLGGLANAQSATPAAPKGEIDRSATFRFAYVGAPLAYDPATVKNQFAGMAYMLPTYDGLVRLDAKGAIVPDLATSWTTSSDGKTITMTLRPNVKFTDGSDLTAAVVVKSLDRMKRDPESLYKEQLASFDSFEAKDPMTVVLHLNTPDANSFYTLSTSTGMIVSAKALDDHVDLSLNPVGTGPYKLVSSGPQGAIYERNEDYWDKSQNQFAKLNILPIVDANARINALQSGQIDAAHLEVNQWPQIEAMVKTGKFGVRRVLQPNSNPLWLNTNVKPLDNPKVRMAMNLAINRDGINQGIQNGLCEPAAQAFMPGVVGFNDSLKPFTQDVEKAKALLKEAGVGPFAIDVLAMNAEPTASVTIALKEQLAAIGVTLNIIPTAPNQVRVNYRTGNYGAMSMVLAVPAPDPASILDAAYLSPDNRGGVSPEMAKAIADARTKPIGSPDREAAYKAIVKASYDNPQHVFVCYSPVLIVYRAEVVGAEKAAYVNAVPIPDARMYGIVKK